MAQPTDQKLLDPGHAFYGYLWYANDTGLWDARNGAMAAKTGSGEVTATGEGDANVVNSAGTTYYSTGALTTIGSPCTIGFKVKRTSPAGDKGMVFGNRGAANSYFWLRSTEVRCFGLTTANANPDSWATFHVVRLADGTGRLYKNATFVANIPWSSDQSISSILDGYAGGAYAFEGALEYIYVIPGLAATTEQLASLHADPYQALDTGIAGALNASASGAALASGTANATTSGGAGVISIPAVKDWGSGALKAGEVNVLVDVYDPSSGSLIVRKSGQTTHAITGVCVITDPLIMPGSTYAVVTRFTDGSVGIWDYTAT